MRQIVVALFMIAAVWPFAGRAETYNAVMIVTYSCSQAAAERVLTHTEPGPRAALAVVKTEPTCVQVGNIFEPIAQDELIPSSVEVIKPLTETMEGTPAPWMVRLYIPAHLLKQGILL